MKTRIFRVAVATIAFNVTFAVTFAQQLVFDTEPTLNGSDLYTPLRTTNLFDRSRRAFEFGLNFNGVNSLDINGILGTSILDDNIYFPWADPNCIGSIPPTEEKLGKQLDGTRFIVVDGGDHTMFYGVGHGIMTRVDPEISVNSTTGIPLIEPSNNTGAVHGFSTRTNCSTEAGHIEFRTTAIPGLLKGNTNNRVIKPSSSSSLTMKKKETSGVGEYTFRDPMRTGEMLVVAVSIRRVGPIATSIDDDDIVLKLRIRRQMRIGDDIYQPDPDQLLRFSIIPEVAESVWVTPKLKQIGVDPLPKLFAGWDNKIEHPIPTGWEYDDMPLDDDAIPATSLQGRELVWQSQKDVRNTSLDNNDALSKEIVITVGMLKQILDGSDEPGSQASDLDGTSDWVLFEGLVVFDEVVANSNDDNLFYFNLQDGFDGLGSKEHNERLDPYGLRGPENTPGICITDLNIEVEYVGNVDVDIDYVSMQTPNSRALMRDMYRGKIEEHLSDLISWFTTARSAVDASDAKQFRLLGFRSTEEDGEQQWYSQRYLNILTSGAMISEINMKPFDRYVHVAYPFSTQGSNFPDDPLPLWVWNESSTGRLDLLTPAPYLKYGGQGEDPNLTLGLKYGVCRTTFNSDPNNTNPCIHAGFEISYPLLGQQESMLSRLLHTHDYEIGWPCKSNTEAGDPHGFLSYMQTMELGMWTDPRAYEQEDGDGQESNKRKVIDDCDKECPAGIPIIDRSVLADMEWEPLAHTSIQLYQNFLSPGNEQLLFSGIPWFEQVWLGVGKTVIRSHIVGATNSLVSFLKDHHNQARPQTAEEVRLRLTTPVLLGSAGVMVFLGGGSHAKETSYPQPKIYNDWFRCVFNNQEVVDGESTTTVDARQRMESTDYGSDYPTSHEEIHIDNGDEPDVDCEGYLDGFSSTKFVCDVDAENLWIPKSVYKRSDNNDVGGWDIVQRVSDDGTPFEPASKVEQIYFGSYSIRREVLRYADWLNTSLPNDFRKFPEFDEDPFAVPPIAASDYVTPLKVRDLVGLLDLQSWHARGYRVFDNWKNKGTAPNPMSKWIDTDRLKTRHPYREFNARADYEDADSMFVDVTLLYRRRLMQDVEDDQYGDKEVYIGVQNRRTNPLYMQDADMEVDYDDVPRFSSAQEFLAMVANPANNHRLYDQIGARSVVLPFEYQYLPGEAPKLLRVTEVGIEIPPEDPMPDDSRIEVLFANNGVTPPLSVTRTRIDTIVDAHGVLELDLLPGEGKLFRVRVLDATSQGDEGNLAFNTQTKLVVAPEQYIEEGVPHQTEKLRYHMVYAKPNDNDEWRVYYKRSIAYERDHLPNVAGLEWNTPIELGNETTVHRQPGQRGTIDQTGNAAWFNNTYPTTCNMEFQAEVPGIDIRAGFPTITIARHIVRNIHQNAPADSVITQKVHIAYGMTLNNGIFIGDEVHIVETVFTDDDNAIPVQGPYPTSSLAIIRGGTPDQYTIETLAEWGTPTNGTSTFLAGGPNDVPPQPPAMVIAPDRVFTAWSIGPDRGIASSVRGAWLAGVNEERYLTANEVDEIQLTQGHQAKYPSLTPYADATRDQWASNASLVWQEQRADAGTDIMYTRCWEIANANPLLRQHNWGVPAAVTMHYGNVAPPAAQGLQVFNIGANSVMRMSENRVGDNNLYPTIVRSTTLPDVDPYYTPGVNSGAMTMTFSDPQPYTCAATTEYTVNYEFEHAMWQALQFPQVLTRIKRRYFIMHPETNYPGPGDVMAYWWIGQSYHGTKNLVAPVIATATRRMDVQRFTATSAPLDWNYFDCYKKMSISGNVSDTASISSFGIVSGNFVGANPAGSIPWTTWTNPANVEQIPLRYIPIPPHAQAVQTEHELSRTDGEWAHISHRLWGVVEQKQSLRRIQSEGGADASPIITSAEYFYKPTLQKTEQWRTLGGFSTGQEEIAVGGIRADGKELTFRQEEHEETMRGAAHIVEAMHTPVQSLVSEAFILDKDLDLDIDVDGSMRDGLQLTIEQVNATTQSKMQGGTTMDVGLPEASQRDEKQERKTTRYYFTKADGEMYRFRLALTQPCVVFEEQVCESLDRAFEKNIGSERVIVVDVKRKSVQSLSDENRILVYPNPAFDHINLVIQRNRMSTGSTTTRILNASGQTIETHVGTEGSSAQTVDVSILPTGVYYAQVIDSFGILGGTMFAIHR